MGHTSLSFRYRPRNTLQQAARFNPRGVLRWLYVYFLACCGLFGLAAAVVVVRLS